MSKKPQEYAGLKDQDTFDERKLAITVDERKVFAEGERRAATIPYELYQALHRVGDDSTKALIERVLYSTLDRATFNKVVGIFIACTDEDLLDSLVEDDDEEFDDEA